jgi:glycosyltransferase involved in cell wall biosynthesis
VEWVVVFAGSRDRYQVPLALAEEHRLRALVTDFYTPKDSALGQVFEYLPPRVRSAFNRRYELGLCSRQSKWSTVGLLADHLANRSVADRDRRLGRMAGNLARREGTGLISYSYYGFAAFHSYGIGHWPKILFQVQPHPVSVRKIFLRELELSESGGTSLRKEEELTHDAMRFEELSKEALLADHCVVASHFAKATLVENGVREDRIHVVPYGVDPGNHPVHRKTDDVFRVVFVGRSMQRKGLVYLLNAWRRMRLPKAELAIVGRGTNDGHIRAAFQTEANWLGEISTSQLSELYRRSDLFCMPSLAEGFGLVYLEALAAGLPVIATPNTGAADIIQNGREGFIVPIRDIEALAEKLEWAYENPSALAEMKVAARRLAEEFSWSRFRAEFMKVVKQIENEGAENSDVGVHPYGSSLAS